MEFALPIMYPQGKLKFGIITIIETKMFQAFLNFCKN